MKLSLRNIGKVSKATVDIQGITVVAGENDTGKSTVGKALFAVFNSFYNIEQQICDERAENVQKLLDLMYRNVTNRYTRRFDTFEIAQAIIADIETFRDNHEILKEEILNAIIQYDEYFKQYVNEEQIDITVKRIIEILQVSDLDIFKTVLDKKLEAEYNSQITNIFADDDGEIQLVIQDEPINIIIRDNHVMSIEGQIDLHTEAVYLDDPFVLDELRAFYLRFGMGTSDHRSRLREKLYFEKKDANIINEIVIGNKFDNIYKKISTICDGDIVRNKQSRYGYKKSNTDKVLDMRNLSTGLKTFVILKMLLQNGAIEYNGTIILDEPEIHLHPEWQLLFAELIVLMYQEFGVHILLNTHSPYFLNAIEVYAAKYGVSDKCKYYLAQNTDTVSVINDVTNNIEEIYKKLARPLQNLENERGRLDEA